MKKRYVVRAVFDDPDFDMGNEGKRFWFRSSAIRAYDELEAERRYGSTKTSGWHYELRDTLTGELISLVI